MVKQLFILILFSLSSPIMATTCLGLYEAKAAKIEEDNAYTTTVGARLFVNSFTNQLAYNPGIKVAGHVDNWARDFIDAIKWDPFFLSMPKNPRIDWLEAFRKSIRKECDLPKDNYHALQSMLSELLKDGSFCPDKKILEPHLLVGKKEFKKILQAAVKDQRFPEHCKNKAVVDDSSREIKDVQTPASFDKDESATEQ